jgi:hypothetical protein
MWRTQQFVPRVPKFIVLACPVLLPPNSWKWNWACYFKKYCAPKDFNGNWSKNLVLPWQSSIKFQSKRQPFADYFGRYLQASITQSSWMLIKRFEEDGEFWLLCSLFQETHNVLSTKTPIENSLFLKFCKNLFICKVKRNDMLAKIDVTEAW